MSLNKDDFAIKKFEGLGLRYILALSAIATTIIFSQIFLQFHIAQQEDDSVEVNLSGRQRMLSQRISKAAILLGTELDSITRIQYLAEIKLSLQEWTRAHEGLQNGNESLGLKGNNSKIIKEMFAVIQPHFQEIVSGASDLITVMDSNSDAIDPEITKEMIQSILRNEGQFLVGMDKIVFQFDTEAQSKVTNLKYIEIALSLLALFLIFLEVRFIFIPSAAMVKGTIKHLEEEESKAKKMALEIGSLYDSLEQSFQNLAAVEVEVEDFTVFAKCAPSGTLYYISERFMEIMEFGLTPPENFFDWLEVQGYESAFLKNIQKLVSQGVSWRGDLRLTNEQGDFVWIKMNIIPTLNEYNSVENLMVISVDESEIIEAQSRSQELHKEKIEKKLKEQQYRSALILEGQEEERRRISRDMHDGIGQYLTALKYNLDGIFAVKSVQERSRLENSKEILQDVIKEVRRISFNLTPVALSDYGIVAVLSKFSKEMSKISKIPIIFENQTGFLSRLEPKTENNLYRIVQEAVNNAIKYSEANEIKILLSHNSKYLHLRIQDDGKGFDYEKLDKNGSFNATGHGIFNIKERANFINGNFQLTTSPEMGTSINIELPLES